MDKQRILKEAQAIASKFSFWMVSGDVSHLYGYVLETPEKKYELEVKFDENFPNSPPELIYYKEIKNLLGKFELDTLKVWTPGSSVLKVLNELNSKLRDTLELRDKKEIPTPKEYPPKMKVQDEQESKKKAQEQEEYLTPDLDAYPPDFNYEQFITNEEPQDLISDKEPSYNTTLPSETDIIVDEDQTNVAVSTELGLIQQEYAYDQHGPHIGDIMVYLTITLTKTFIIHINFQFYPKKPEITIPDEVYSLLGDPNQSLETLLHWNSKQPPHVVEILRELEKRLYFLKDIELESKKIAGEYQCEVNPNDITKLSVHLVTYGFNEYLLDFDIGSYPKPPIVALSPELQGIIQTPIEQLSAYKNWTEGESEPVSIIREIAWLVDKYSRINFEIELLKDHYKDINYDPATNILKVAMKGKMKTQDLTFQFQIDLPREYPMKVPTIKVINEFEIEAHEKIKRDLQNSFRDFFDEWTPFSYLVDLFNSISKKIFEVSVVSCVICHKIECPTCSLKIAGSEGDNCHIDCPYCERSYHKHCWEQTIKSFGKCGFCLKTPPPDFMP